MQDLTTSCDISRFTDLTSSKLIKLMCQWDSRRRKGKKTKKTTRDLKAPRELFVSRIQNTVLLCFLKGSVFKASGFSYELAFNSVYSIAQGKFCYL